MQPIYPITSNESPREILEADFKSLRGALPIRGGWGYTKSDACIIDKNDPIVDSTRLFDGVSLEYIFVEKRIYEELIIFRPDGEKFTGIQWTLQEQTLLEEDSRYFDRLVFEVTAFRDNDWEELKAEFEGPQGHGTPGFFAEAHEKKCQEKMVRFTGEFWFDITSFHGKGEPGNHNMTELSNLTGIAPHDDRCVVLLVDDQQMIGEAIRRMLVDEPDIEFHYCDDANDAVRVAEQVKPTVILQDCGMPDMDDITLIKSYRAAIATQSVPIIMLSTRSDSCDKSKAFGAGANDYLVKIPDQIELVARIRMQSRNYLAQLQRDDAFKQLRAQFEDKTKSFHTYLEMRIQEKREQLDMPGTSERSHDLLKIEVAELDVIRSVFEKYVFHD